MSDGRRPTLAVWKFASCDGCQLTLLDCEDELLAVADRVDIAYFLEASSATVEGPYDVSLVEGSITTAHDVERIQEAIRTLYDQALFYFQKATEVEPSHEIALARQKKCVPRLWGLTRAFATRDLRRRWNKEFDKMGGRFTD